MISEYFAAEQVDRLSGLRFFPVKDAAVQELVNALRKLAQSEEHAGQIISEWIEQSREAPTPADFYAMRRTMRKTSSIGNDPYAEYVPEWKTDKKGPKPC